MKMKLPLTALAVLMCGPLLSQKLSNVRAVVNGSTARISYDLAAGEPGEKFRVSLYGSHDNFSAPLKMVSGDIGDQPVAPGNSKQVNWDGGELKSFQGAITFEVRAEVIPAPLTITGPAAGDKFKKGRTIDVTWSKSRSGTLELQRNGVTVSKMGEGSNGKMSWTLPSDVKPGGGYQIRFTSGGESALSGKFRVAPKVPLVAIVLPALAVGATAYLLLGGEKEESLPLPPDPQ